jgi:glycosyltransferase involved in cell wall biosynthesis
MQQLPEYRLDLIGDGPQKSVLQAFAAAQGLRNVTFLEWLGEKRFDHLARALALIVPSETHDQFPTTILEAFALGVPVIGSQMGGIPTLVRPGETGYLFPPGDSDALAEHIRHLSNDRHLAHALGLNARRLVETHYTPEVFYQRLSAIYERSLSQKSGP